MLRQNEDEAKKLQLKQLMLTKLDRNVEWSYIPTYLPTNLSELSLVQNILEFIDNHIDEALQKSAAVLPFFTELDSESIGSDNPSANVKKLFDLINFLEEKGFPGPVTFGKPILLYSGIEGMKKASEVSTELSLLEGMIPAFTVLFDLWCTAQDNINPELIFCTISRLLTSYASGVVNVYLSSKDDISPSGFTLGSYFWDVELEVLQNNKNVSTILIHIYDTQNKQWQAPTNFYSRECGQLPIHIIPVEDRYKPTEDIEPKNITTLPVNFGYVRNLLSIWAKKPIEQENNLTLTKYKF